MSDIESEGFPITPSRPLQSTPSPRPWSVSSLRNLWSTQPDLQPYIVPIVPTKTPKVSEIVKQSQNSPISPDSKLRNIQEVDEFGRMVGAEVHRSPSEKSRWRRISGVFGKHENDTDKANSPTPNKLRKRTVSSPEYRHENRRNTMSVVGIPGSPAQVNVPATVPVSAKAASPMRSRHHVPQIRPLGDNASPAPETTLATNRLSMPISPTLNRTFPGQASSRRRMAAPPPAAGAGVGSPSSPTSQDTFTRPPRPLSMFEHRQANRQLIPTAPKAHPRTDAKAQLLHFYLILETLHVARNLLFTLNIIALHLLEQTELPDDIRQNLDSRLTEWWLNASKLLNAAFRNVERKYAVLRVQYYSKLQDQGILDTEIEDDLEKLDEAQKDLARSLDKDHVFDRWARPLVEDPPVDQSKLEAMVWKLEVKGRIRSGTFERMYPALKWKYPTAAEVFDRGDGSCNDHPNIGKAGVGKATLIGRSLSPSPSVRSRRETRRFASESTLEAIPENCEQENDQPPPVPDKDVAASNGLTAEEMHENENEAGRTNIPDSPVSAGSTVSSGTSYSGRESRMAHHDEDDEEEEGNVVDVNHQEGKWGKYRGEGFSLSQGEQEYAAKKGLRQVDLDQNLANERSSWRKRGLKRWSLRLEQKLSVTWG